MRRKKKENRLKDNRKNSNIIKVRSVIPTTLNFKP